MFPNVDICMKIHKNSLKGFQVIERILSGCELVMDDVPREITQKVKRQELPFLHSASRLMLIDVCMNFCEDSLSGFRRYRSDTDET